MQGKIWGSAGNGRYQIVELSLEDSEAEAREDSQDKSGVQDKFPARYRRWLNATALGFHDQERSEEESEAHLRLREPDQRTLLAAYPLFPLPDPAESQTPVATFASLPGTLNVGGPQLLAAHMITSVTVKPTDRRKGLLREMMTLSLQHAHREQIPIAALTASEGTIYRRFGFGPATLAHTIRLDTRGGLEFKRAFAGRLVMVHPSKIEAFHAPLFAHFHERTLGSISRQAFHPRFAAGLLSPDSILKPDPKVRSALYYDGDAQLAGYLSYKVKGEEWPAVIEVMDLVSISEEAYLALIEFVGSIDLAETATFEMAPARDPLPWALSDPRRYRVSGSEDLLWLRILDVKSALEARSWEEEGTFSLQVSDSLQLAHGRYRITLAQGRATVERQEGQSAHRTNSSGAHFPEVGLDIADLSTLYLGGDSGVRCAGTPLTKMNTGAPLSETERNTFARWFRTAAEPYCITHF